MNLQEYTLRTKNLPYVHIFSECCGRILAKVVAYEPLDQRNIFEVESRSCVIKCTVCGKEYLSTWD